MKNIKLSDLAKTNVAELVEEFKSSGLSKIRVRNGDIELELELPVIGQAQAGIQVTTADASVPNITKKVSDTGTAVSSPLVGTYYASPAPGKPKFVEIGREVKKGDVLCIIEAMKIMNEIKAPVSGRIADIHVDEAQMVEYDELLFTIE